MEQNGGEVPSVALLKLAEASAELVTKPGLGEEMKLRELKMCKKCLM